MDTERTILAVASPAGQAARGIVRASGRGACAAVAAALDAGHAGHAAVAARTRGVHAVRLADPAIPALVIVMPGPASATGEDCVEIHAVGNPLVLERIADAVVARAGGDARRAHPGEFSVRGVLNGRLAIADAERVAAAVEAETDAELVAADALRSGDAGRAAATDADELANVLALVEAGIDFTDQEDVTAIARTDLERRVGAVRTRLRARLAAGSGTERTARAPRVVLAGPPNAGKSSLFNALLGVARAVESPERGTTRDAIEHSMTLPGGGEAVLVDAPGFDDAVQELDLLVQQRAADALRRADVVLACRRADDGDDAPLPIAAHGQVVIAVRTQCDRDASHDGSALRTSARTGEGLDALRTAIAGAVAGRTARGAAESTLGAARAALLVEAADALEEALGVQAPELVAAALRTALDRLGEVAGAIPPDDVLGRLFAGFCIGK
jgi:tRNA modification GTPase